MWVMEHFLLLVPSPLPGCIFMRHIILALFTVYQLLYIYSVFVFRSQAWDFGAPPRAGGQAQQVSDFSIEYIHRIHALGMFYSRILKVLTNEKRGGLKVVAFNRSDFKLFTLRFSNKAEQAQSCERNKTSQRNLFLSFEINNCFPITV